MPGSIVPYGPRSVRLRLRVFYLHGTKAVTLNNQDCETLLMQVALSICRVRLLMAGYRARMAGFAPPRNTADQEEATESNPYAFRAQERTALKPDTPTQPSRDPRHDQG